MKHKTYWKHKIYWKTPPSNRHGKLFIGDPPKKKSEAMRLRDPCALARRRQIILGAPFTQPDSFTTLSCWDLLAFVRGIGLFNLHNKSLTAVQNREQFPG